MQILRRGFDSRHLHFIINLKKGNIIQIKDNYDKIVLDNGVTLLLERIEGYQSASIGFFVNSGSRDEKYEQSGFSHFCEHMIFKGTTNYNKNQIANMFDRMGGFINAYTTHELIFIYNRTPYLSLINNLNLIAELYNNSIFDKTEMDLERDVIINEIKSTLENPEDKIQEDFFGNLFDGYSLGRPIIGTEKNISSVTRDELYDFYCNLFTSDNLTISISGNFNKQEAIDLISKIKFRRSKVIKSEKALQSIKTKDFSLIHSEQLHILMGTSNFKLTEEEYFRCGLLNVVVGESMSSKLFQRIREELGLCYYIYSYFNKYRYENMFSIYVSVLPKNADKTIVEISNALKEIKSKGINKKELEQIKNQKTNEILLNYDVLQKRMQRLALINLKYDKYYSHSDIIELIKNTKIDDINSLIERIFNKDLFFTQYLYKKKLNLVDWDF
ncbi:MAG TPA: pitrilysin family protein [Spirochaetota bacterium]|nr:pitrilysin family protein [Spirochaetota bacterium]HOS32471.1 pitrilysin family protein [Spirochaetota bacterium]HOS54808.1 pitrilysin family protein [Spirochaetota bacterium]HPK61502.1 pitrilysin family protein [Spirochaetota bacterium]HQF76763.1 pitrilysin family protein [Spirochaetota bacterium]